MFQRTAVLVLAITVAIVSLACGGGGTGSSQAVSSPSELPSQTPTPGPPQNVIAKPDLYVIDEHPGLSVDWNRTDLGAGSIVLFGQNGIQAGEIVQKDADASIMSPGFLKRVQSVSQKTYKMDGETVTDTELTVTDARLDEAYEKINTSASFDLESGSCYHFDHTPPVQDEKLDNVTLDASISTGSSVDLTGRRVTFGPVDATLTEGNLGFTSAVDIELIKNQLDFDVFDELRFSYDGTFSGAMYVEISAGAEYSNETSTTLFQRSYPASAAGVPLLLDLSVELQTKVDASADGVVRFGGEFEKGLSYSTSFRPESGWSTNDDGPAVYERREIHPPYMMIDGGVEAEVSLIVKFAVYICGCIGPHFSLIPSAKGNL